MSASTDRHEPKTMHRVLALVLLAAGGVVACSGDDGSLARGEPGPQAGQKCVPNAQTSCACPGGATGVQTCRADGAGLTACACGGSDPSDSGAPGSGDAGDGEAGSTPPRCDPSKPFGTPVAMSNTDSANNFRLAPDELSAYFDRLDNGKLKIHRTTRANRTAPFGAPVLVADFPNDSFVGGLWAPSVSSDGLGMAMIGRPLQGDFAKLYYASRTSTAMPFGAPSSLGALTIAGVDNLNPFLTADGLSVYWRASGQLRVATRANVNGAFGAAVPVALQAGENSGASSPLLSVDELTLYFSRSTGAGDNNEEIYVATRASKAAAFGPSTAVANVNSSSDDGPKSITADGCELYLGSFRSGVVKTFVAQRPL